MVSIMKFLPSKIVKPRISSPRANLRNSYFCKRFQNSEFLEFLGAFEFLEGIGMTPLCQIL